MPTQRCSIEQWQEAQWSHQLRAKQTQTLRLGGPDWVLPIMNVSTDARAKGPERVPRASGERQSQGTKWQH